MNSTDESLADIRQNAKKIVSQTPQAKESSVEFKHSEPDVLVEQTFCLKDTRRQKRRRTLKKQHRATQWDLLKTYKNIFCWEAVLGLGGGIYCVFLYQWSRRQFDWVFR